MSAGRPRAEARTVSPRALVIALVCIVTIGALVIGGLVWWRLRADRLAGFPGGSGRVAIAGVIPAADAAALRTPVSAEIRRDILYVTEAAAGVIRMFTLDGEPRGSIVVPRAAGAPTAYPTDMAVLDDDTILVVDTSGQRIVALSTRQGRTDPLEFVVGAGSPGDSPRQPTAIAADRGVIVVADGTDGSLRRFDRLGRPLGIIPLRVSPALTFVGGLSISESTMSVTDATSGRVLSLDVSTGKVLGTGAAAAQRPRGTALDGDRRVWVADTIGRRVTLLSASLGETVLTVTGTEANPLAGVPESLMGFGSPSDVAWARQRSRIYVVDSAAGRVKVFNIRR